MDDVVRSYQDLRVWREAMTLAEVCYRFTQNFPKAEQFGLTAQMRRAAVSIPSNIAEGYGRENTGSYIQFLRIAQGSCKELETQVLISQRVLEVAAADSSAILDHVQAVGKMLRGLIRSLQNE